MTSSDLAVYLVRVMFYPFAMGGVLGHAVLGLLWLIAAFGFVSRLTGRSCS